MRGKEGKEGGRAAKKRGRRSTPLPSTPALGPRRGEARAECESTMLEVVVDDRLGRKIRVKCNEEDTIGDLKLLIAAQTGTFFARRGRADEGGKGGQQVL